MDPETFTTMLLNPVMIEKEGLKDKVRKSKDPLYGQLSKKYPHLSSVVTARTMKRLKSTETHYEKKLEQLPPRYKASTLNPTRKAVLERVENREPNKWEELDESIFKGTFLDEHKKGCILF